MRALKIPRETTAFANRGDWHNITINPSWGNRAEFDKYCRQWCQSLVNEWAAMEKSDHSIKDKVVGLTTYPNGSSGDEKVAFVFKDKYPRLRELKRKYDPDMVFRKWYPITPAD